MTLSLTPPEPHWLAESVCVLAALVWSGSAEAWQRQALACASAAAGVDTPVLVLSRDNGFEAAAPSHINQQLLECELFFAARADRHRQPR